MADMIARLKVDSSEYDSKVKRAAEGILSLERTIREAGESFLATWKDEQEFAKGLGQMETVSKTARGKISELTSAFTDLSMTYKRMTDEEKASPFGKALQGSLDQLKGRIQEAKKDLADINKELGNTGKEGQNAGSIIDQLSGKLGISTNTLMGWGAAIGAAKVALDTAKASIESTEAGHDALAKATAVTDNITNQFLRSLATADFSNFINGMQGVIDKTIAAYEAMDEFESYAARFQPWQQAQESEIQTKLQQARAAKAKGDKEKAERLTNEAKTLIDKLEASTKAYGEKQTAGGYETIRSLMGNVDITNNQIAWYADPNNWEEAKKSAQSFKNKIEEINNLKANVGLSYSYDSNATKRNNERIAEIESSITPRERRAYTMLNLRDSENSEQAQLLKRALTDIYGNTLAKSRIESLRARAERMDGVISGSGSGSSKQLTKPEQAQAKFEQAEKDYQQALEQAALEVKAGTANTAEAKKKELSAAENLWKSIGDAREIYDSEELKKAQEEAAKKVVELGGSVNTLIEEQKKAQEAARELTSAQKKAAEANRKMADALAANDYNAYQAAYKQYTTAQADVQRLQPVEVPILPKWEQKFLDALPEELKKYVSKGIEVPVSMTYTQSNMSAFIGRLNEHLAQTDLGTTLYQNLTKQLADANMLANLMQTAVKNGIDIAQFDPQTLFNKIFGENPGDYIEDAKWEEIRKKIEEIIGKPITIDVNTGTVNVNGNGSKDEQKKNELHLGQLANNVLSITRSLNDLGVEIPEGLTKVLSTMNIITTILTTISTLAGITASTSILKSIPVIGWFLQNGGVVHAAEGWSGIVPGNYMSGDQVPAMLNSGELVLNKAQSGVIASALNGIENGGFAGRSMATIESDQIRIVLQNGAQAKGMTISEYLGIG